MDQCTLMDGIMIAETLLDFVFVLVSFDTGMVVYMFFVFNNMQYSL